MKLTLQLVVISVINKYSKLINIFFMHVCWSCLKTGPARPGHVKIALVITAVDFYQFSLYSTSTFL